MNNEMQFIMDFYQKSWDKLLFVISITGFVITIIWPVLILFFNYKGNDNYKKELDRNIDEKTKGIESRIKEIERKEKCLNGNMFYIQAQSASEPFLKIIGILNAYLCFIEAKDTISMTIIYNYLSPYLQNNQMLKIKTAFNTEQLYMVKMLVEKIYNGLNQLNDDTYCKYQINIFEDFRKRLDE